MPTQHAADRFIARQIAYYRARASEFDLSHHQPTPELRAALDRFGPRGKVLELACGTGIWTAEILRHPVDELTCIDAAPEMLEIHASNISDPRVRRERHDLFRWESEERYDAVIFAFWLSHVPPSRFPEFWGAVESALKPGGRVFFIDDDQRAEVTEERIPEAEVPAVLRTLDDGTAHVAVKVFHEPQSLADDLDALGWAATVTLAGTRFLWGTASRRRDSNTARRTAGCGTGASAAEGSMPHDGPDGHWATTRWVRGAGAPPRAARRPGGARLRGADPDPAGGDPTPARRA